MGKEQKQLTCSVCYNNEDNFVKKYLKPEDLINPKQYKNLKHYDYYVEDWIYGRHFLLTKKQLKKSFFYEGGEGDMCE